MAAEAEQAEAVAVGGGGLCVARVFVLLVRGVVVFDEGGGRAGVFCWGVLVDGRVAAAVAFLLLWSELR